MGRLRSIWGSNWVSIWAWVQANRFGGASPSTAWRASAVLLALALSAVSGSARADYDIVPLDPDAAARGVIIPFGARMQKHTGMLLRLQLGGGYMQAATGDLGGSLRVRGGGLDGSLSIGGMVTPNFGIFGAAFGGGVLNASTRADARAPFPEDDTALWTAAGGVGFTYYLMPSNVYLSVAVGPGFMRLIEDSYDVDERQVGFASEWSVAKEWWVGPEVGMGIGGRFVFMAIPGGRAVDYNVFNASIVLSTTFN